MTMKGTVTAVNSRTVTTKYGAKPVFDVVVDGTKYGYGFKDPTKAGLSVGAYIAFDFTAGKYGPDMLPGSVKVITGGTGVAATPVAPSPRSTPTASPAASGGGWRDAGFPVPVTSEKISILRQNALTNAVKTVGDFPTNFVTSELTPNELIDHILEVARKFADYTSGRDAERAVAALTEKMDTE